MICVGKTGAFCLPILQITWETLKDLQGGGGKTTADGKKGDATTASLHQPWAMSFFDRGPALAVTPDGNFFLAVSLFCVDSTKCCGAGAEITNSGSDSFLFTTDLKKFNRKNILDAEEVYLNCYRPFLMLLLISKKVIFKVPYLIKLPIRGRSRSRKKYSRFHNTATTASQWFLVFIFLLVHSFSFLLNLLELVTTHLPRS
jgi:hypothetical protein